MGAKQMIEYSRIIGDPIAGEKFWRAKLTYNKHRGTYQNVPDLFQYEVHNFTTCYHDGEAYEEYFDGYNSRHHSKFYFTFISKSRENITDDTEKVLLKMLWVALDQDVKKRLETIAGTVKTEMMYIRHAQEGLNHPMYRAHKIEKLDL